ncbi:MAG: sulfite exporter TauE/SafE family protein [Phycisphaerales bacterium]
MIADSQVVALLSTTLAASLLGSLHCAGMCGGLVAFTAQLESPKRPSIVATQSAYNGGRLVAYAALGAVAGSLGAALDLTGRFTGLQRTASVVAGLSIAVVGLVAILRAVGVRLPKAPVPAPFVELARRVHMRAFALSPLARATAVGLATPLLPCGWLYAFVAIAAGAGSPLGGALVMSAFWLGTLPALLAVAGGLRAATGPLRRSLPLIAGLAMLAVGLHVAFVRGPLAAQVAAATVVRPATDAAEAEDRAASANDELPPCCRESK